MKRSTNIILTLILILVLGVAAGYWWQHRKTPSSAFSTAEHDQSLASRTENSGSNNPVFLVVLENQTYEDIMGNTQDMPYLNDLAHHYAYASNYYANTHPSIGNYFMLTTGNVITNDDGFDDTVSQDNIVRELEQAHKSFRVYTEDLPQTGYTGDDKNGYTEHHNPLSYFSDVRDNEDLKQNLVSSSELSQDIARHTLPDFGLIIPNNQHNGHNCPAGKSHCNMHDKLAATDAWLKETLEPILQSDAFGENGHGTLIITYDEADKSKKGNGGGHIIWIIAGPDVKTGFVSDTFYQHQSTLRFILERLDVHTFPGMAKDAPDMKEFLR